MRRLLWGCAALVVCVMAAGSRVAIAQGATTCDSPCKVIHLPLVGPRGAVCDSPCKLILLPLVTNAPTVSQAKLPFVVDTLGRAELGSLRILKSTHPLFSAAVRNALPRMRFLPAMRAGVKVRELVQQPFVFNVVHH